MSSIQKINLTSICFMFLSSVSQHASGVEVYEGVESVLLPCQIQADDSRSSTAVLWRFDEFKNPQVHVRLLSGDNLHDQNVRYVGRTSMRADALQTGDLSLTLRNPTVFDSGTYTCITLRSEEELSWTEVQLKVTGQLTENLLLQSGPHFTYKTYNIPVLSACVCVFVCPVNTTFVKSLLQLCFYTLYLHYIIFKSMLGSSSFFIYFYLILFIQHQITTTFMLCLNMSVTLVINCS
uniref:Ig-like domain-containing protein n=1 Tax=Neolamprologus brichardi TaxID=32507 RepID=A0A3Q4GM43_NEOBR